MYNCNFCSCPTDIQHQKFNVATAEGWPYWTLQLNKNDQNVDHIWLLLDIHTENRNICLAVSLTEYKCIHILCQRYDIRRTGIKGLEEYNLSHSGGDKD